MAKNLVVKGASTPERETVLTKSLAKKASKKSAKEIESAYADDSGPAQAEPITEDTLQALRNLAQQVVDGERDLQAKTEAVKKAAEELAKIQEDRLPKLMQQKGLERFDFVDATTGLRQTIKLDDKLRVAMPSKKVGNRFIVDIDACKPIFAWLREIGEGGSVKKTVQIPAGLVDDERVMMLMEHIKNFDNTLDPGLTEKIEPATLTSLVTRLRGEGKNVHEALRVTPILSAKVSSK